MSLFLYNTPSSPKLFLPCFSFSSVPGMKTRITPLLTKSSNSMALSVWACSRLPARDRVIDFGKYKGRMLGTLPSTYLKWVSNNLRARDFEEWAKLADQVLQDPVYQDRLEWEFAQKVLNGDVLTTPSSSSSSAVSALVEISERFGWNNEDKLGWSKLNFELLGTSKGGRIPRIARSKDKGLELKREEDMGLSYGARRGGGGAEEEEEEEAGCDEEAGVRERREERRERLKLQRSNIPITSKRLARLRDGIDRIEMKRDKSGYPDKNQTVDVYNPFPGREGLLRKVLNAKGKRGAL